MTLRYRLLVGSESGSVDERVSNNACLPGRAAPLAPESPRCGGQTLCAHCVRTCEATIEQVGSIYGLPARDRDDFVQEAWLGILTALRGGRFDPRRGRLADWLFVVARNRAVTLARRRWRAQRVVVDFPLDLLPCRVSQDPAQSLDRLCDRERVQHAVELLKQRVAPRVFAVFSLRRMEQLSVREVARRLQLTDAQVRVLDYRARRKLAALLRSLGRV